MPRTTLLTVSASEIDFQGESIGLVLVRSPVIFRKSLGFSFTVRALSDFLTPDVS
jgi:hypothetical protein